MNFEIVASGPLFPKGPFALQNGSVPLVEIVRGTPNIALGGHDMRHTWLTSSSSERLAAARWPRSRPDLDLDLDFSI